MTARALAVAMGWILSGLVAAQSPANSVSRDSLAPVLLRNGVDTATMGVLVYYARGSESHARELGTMLAEGVRYYRDSLGVDLEPDIALVLVDSVQWRLATKRTFGLPFYHPSYRVLFLPSTTIGPDAESFLRLESRAPPAAMTTVQRQHRSWSNGVGRLLDLILLHEIGHVVVARLKIEPPNRWFNEWLATYLAYAFMRSKHPEDARLWDAMCDAQLAVYSPQHRTLADFEGGALANDDYMWYESAFQPQVRATYQARGLGFIGALRQEFGTAVTPRPTPAELLARLEEMTPGFKDWAARTFGDPTR
jgi:hypothetical protein